MSMMNADKTSISGGKMLRQRTGAYAAKTHKSVYKGVARSVKNLNNPHNSTFSISHSQRPNLVIQHVGFSL